MEQSKMPQNDAEWEQKLTPEQYKVLRQKGTEAPFSGRLLHEARDGVYRCAACCNVLFASNAKFDSGSGWPSFDQALPGATKLIPDNSLGIVRAEVVCAQCGSHLGHLFHDLPAGRQAANPQAEGRYCMNSVCLAFAEEKK